MGNVVVERGRCARVAIPDPLPAWRKAEEYRSFHSYLVSIKMGQKPKPSDIEEALKSAEAVSILGGNASTKSTLLGSRIEVAVSGGKELSDENLAALAAVIEAYIEPKKVAP